MQNAKIAKSGQFISVKERAAFDAVMSGALMGAAIGKGIQLANEYELVELIRNDELIHRNRSVRELQTNP